ncbi:MAG: DUF3343 domain-containing protein [Firmicutes bacterium]|nr:DUF3343 domain-containing protein [Bacillota bacterium]
MKILVTFHTTFNVLTLEKYAKLEKIEGRILPTPRKFSASCGLSWMGPYETELKLKEIIEKYNIEFDKIYELE